MDYTTYFLMIREDDPEGTERDVIAYTLYKTKGTGENQGTAGGGHTQRMEPGP